MFDETKHRLIIIILTLVIAAGVTFFYINYSYRFFFNLSNYLPNASGLYKFSVEKVIEAYDNGNDDVVGYLIESESNDKKSVVGVLLFGIFADERSKLFLDKLIAKNLKKDKLFNLVDRYNIQLVTSAGFAELTEHKTTLIEQLNLKSLDDDKERSVERRNFIIAESLYFITGERYSYKKPIESSQISLPRDRKKIREVVVKSSGRDRTYEEMKALFHYTLPTRFLRKNYQP